jgi:hypothetical protein
MFVIVNKGYVILGPKPWNKLMFQEVLLEECEVEYTLETKNPNNTPIIVDENTSILPVIGLPEPSFNSKIQRLEGPYWNLSDTQAEMYYTVGDLPVDAVKNQLKAVAINNRYTYETRGVKIIIQGTEVTVDTSRGSRDIFFDAYLSIGEDETINWKFPEGFFTVNKTELGLAVSAGKSHIQNAFDWEMTKTVEIDACVTLAELNAVVLTTPEEQ